MEQRINVKVPKKFTYHIALCLGETLRCKNNSHAELLESWKWSSTVFKVSEMKGRIIGVNIITENLGICFACCLEKVMSTKLENLSDSLQTSS